MFLGWDRDDQDIVLEVFLRDLATHSACGTRHADWDPEQGGHPRAFTAEVDVCPGCAELARGEALMARKRDKGQLEKGSYLTLRRRRKP